ncbi:MAG: hypothetical protein ACRDG4_06515 [Chloroflexota bacterium]
MLVFLFLIALVAIGFTAGRMRRAPAALDGAALAGLAALTFFPFGGIHLLMLVVGVLVLAGGFVGGATTDVKGMSRRRLGGGGGGLLGR